jgi:hypothetical protein
VAATKTVTYPDSLFFNALLGAINGATTCVEVATFLFKTGYVGETRAKEVSEALQAAAGRGVTVLVILNYSRFEPDVCETNYATGQVLAAAGCQVRMAPRNQTMHTKLAIIDLAHVFLGSHNLTRGALSFNRELTVYTRTVEMARRATRYFNDVWALSTPIAQVEAPTEWLPVQIEVTAIDEQATGVQLAFTVNHAEGVDAFAAIASPYPNLAGAVMGESVASTIRVASVTPTVAEGEPVYVAVRAYSAGQTLATSLGTRLLATTYEPPAPPDEPLPDDPPDDPDTPPPMPFNPPTLQTVAQVSAESIHIVWFWVGPAGFHRFEIQQRNSLGDWTNLATSFDQPTQEWTGPALSMDPAQTVRVVVYNMEEEWQASNELPVTLQGSQPGTLQAPVLQHAELYPSGDAYLVWNWLNNMPEPPFDHFAVQQLDETATWQTLATMVESTVGSWTGTPLSVPLPTQFRVVAVDAMSGEAGSNVVEVME